jgi:hypothetical protein
MSEMAAKERGLSKIQTEAIRDDTDFARRVRWVDWDSGWRGSGLRVGDRVVADQGGPYAADTDKRGAVGPFSRPPRSPRMAFRSPRPASAARAPDTIPERTTVPPAPSRR